MAVRYTITGQRQTSIIGDNGQLVNVWEVTYKTPAGVVGHVDIPFDQYNPANVDAAISALVDVHGQIAQLGQS